MNEELQKRLLEAWDAVSSMLVATKDFAAEQIPIVIQEILAWELYSSITYLVLGLAMVITALCFIPKFIKKAGTTNSDEQEMWIFLTFVMVISLVAGSIISFRQVRDIIKITVAPRVYLLQDVFQVQKLVK